MKITRDEVEQRGEEMNKKIETYKEKNSIIYIVLENGKKISLFGNIWLKNRGNIRIYKDNVCIGVFKEKKVQGIYFKQY